MPDEKDGFVLDEDLVAAQGGELGTEGIPVATEAIPESEPVRDGGLGEHHML